MRYGLFKVIRHPEVPRSGLEGRRPESQRPSSFEGHSANGRLRMTELIQRKFVTLWELRPAHPEPGGLIWALPWVISRALRWSRVWIHNQLIATWRRLRTPIRK